MCIINKIHPLQQNPRLSLILTGFCVTCRQMAEGNVHQWTVDGVVKYLQGMALATMSRDSVVSSYSYFCILFEFYSCCNCCIVACYSHSLGTSHRVMAPLLTCMYCGTIQEVAFFSVLGTSHSITKMKWGSRTVELQSMM